MLNRRSFFAASAAGIAAGVLPRVEPLKQAMTARYPGPETQYAPASYATVQISQNEFEYMAVAAESLLAGQAIDCGPYGVVREGSEGPAWPVHFAMESASAGQRVRVRVFYPEAI